MAATQCSKCKADIAAADHYTDGRQILCEQCYMDLRTPYARKTHWQYIRSIKGDYLKKPQK